MSCGRVLGAQEGVALNSVATDQDMWVMLMGLKDPLGARGSCVHHVFEHLLGLGGVVAVTDGS